MKIPLLLFAACFMASCASIENEPDDTLYSKYVMYSSEADEDSIKVLYSKYFSNDLLGSESINDPEVVEQLLFKEYMKNYSNHVEKIANRAGCLTVNGFDEENKPITFNLEYTAYHGQWLISDIHILFLDDESKFLDIARCPDYYRNL